MVKKRRKNILKHVILIVFVITLLSTPFLHFIDIISFADGYTDVLTDLQKDEDFNAEDYPAIEDDYTIQVIQIAESAGKELFIYTYQPSGQNKPLQATTISISTGINDNISYKLYGLTLLSSKDTLFKYKVNNFNIKDDVVRYYDISEIMRPFDEIIDEDLSEDNENTIDEVSFEVAKLWTACTLNNNVTYTCLATDTILITDKYVGLVRYSAGFGLNANACDSHYVAFSTERQIDKLMEADVYFVTQHYGSTQGSFGYSSITYDEPVENYVELSPSEVEYEGSGWFSKRYTWNRIETVEQFKSENDLTEENLADLDNKLWVLRFVETGYTLASSGMYIYEYGTKVSEVSILRLKFETEGVVYNLGVIDNKQTGNGVPDNIQSWDFSILNLILGIIGALLLLAVVLPLIAPFIPAILSFLCTMFGWLIKGIYTIAKWLIKGLWWVITSPFAIFEY